MYAILFNILICSEELKRAMLRRPPLSNTSTSSMGVFYIKQHYRYAKQFDLFEYLYVLPY